MSNIISKIKLGETIYELRDASKYTKTEVDNKINAAIVGAAEYLGPVATADAFAALAPNSKGDFARVTTSFTIAAAASATGAAVTVHAADLLICEAVKGKDSATATTWSVVHGEMYSKTNNTGAHTHKVAVPTVSSTTKNIGATASGTALNTPTSTFVKSYPGATSKLATTSIVPAVAGGTASKATAGAAITYGNANVGTAVAVGTGLGGTKTFVTGVTKGSAASWSASVDNDGVLSFSWTANTPSTSAGTGTVSLTTANITPAVTSSSKLTPYTFENVDVATAGTAVIVATGKLSGTDTNGATILTGLGDPATGSAVTGVSVKTEPTITVKEVTSGGVSVVTKVSVGSEDKTTTSTGAHEHTLQ